MARKPITTTLDVEPESDRLEPYPHPRDTAKLYGQPAAEAHVLALAQAGRLHHALLISGQEGIGKATFAYRLARYLLAPELERANGGASLDLKPEAATARLVSARSHPGLLVLRRPYDPKAKRFTAFTTVDEVRRLKGFLAHSAEEGGARVVIVDTADDLNANAANALLKSLEEPPPSTYFMILSAAPGRLIATIRSRCRQLRLADVAGADLDAAVRQALAAGGLDPPNDDVAPALDRLAKGSVRRCLMLAAEGGLRLVEAVDGILGALPKVDWPKIHALGDSLAPAAEEARFLRFVDLMDKALAGLIRARAIGGAEAGDATQQLATRLITEEYLPAWTEAWRRLVEGRALTEDINLDRRSYLLRTVADLEALAGGRGLPAQGIPAGPIR